MNLNLNLLLFFLFVVLSFSALGQVNVLNAERPEEIGVLSENQEEILPTIVSRCQIVNLRPIESSALTDVIEKKTNYPIINDQPIIVFMGSKKNEMDSSS